MFRWGRIFVPLALVACVFVPTAALALDTEEVFDRGATDVEFYLGSEGLGLARADTGVFAEMVLGYGLTPWLNGMMGVTLDADAYLNGASQAVYGALFATAVDTDHVDFDVRLDLRTDGDVFATTPGFELNLDAAPEMASWGAFLQGGLVVFGELDPAGGNGEIRVGVETTLGLYARVAEVHMLLFAVDAMFLPDAKGDEHTAELGGIALGYNVGLSDAFELISELHVNLPQTADEEVSASLMLGFVVTLP